MSFLPKTQKQMQNTLKAEAAIGDEKDQRAERHDDRECLQHQIGNAVDQIDGALPDPLMQSGEVFIVPQGLLQGNAIAYRFFHGFSLPK